MTWPIRIWLSIVFVFLLVTGTWNSETSSEKPYEQQTGGNENYDVIDVANEQNNGYYDKLLTGQTTRIVLSGEVDDDFWLKHLGEDYKHAIHLVVGNQAPYRDEYHESYNEGYHDNYNHNHNITTKHHHATATGVNRAFDAHAENYVQPEEYPVENIQMENVAIPKTDANYDTESINVALESTGSSTISNTTEKVETSELKETNVENGSKEPNTSKVTNKTEAVASNNPYEEQAAYERIFAMEDTNLPLANVFYNPNSFYMPNEKPHKHLLHDTDTPHKYNTQTKFTHPESYTNTNANSQPEATLTEDPEHSGDENGNQLNQSNYSTTSGQNPIIVNLPDTDNTIIQHHGRQDKPVVVKMPPVIYHRNSQQYTSPTTQQYIPQIFPYPLSHGFPNYYHQTQASQQPYEPPTPNSGDSLKDLRFYLSNLSLAGEQYVAEQEQPKQEEEGSGASDESSQ